jgi:phenylpropionate dioxygenase-like ring-hydroxylating dioxygenase large terminal subunit
VDYRTLVDPTRVHGSLYTEPGVFAEELARIWYRGWVFVAHASELAEPGDYVTRRIGRQPVIVSRAEDGAVHVLLNRCSHRANLICQADRGSAYTFRCPYHGWTFTNTGELVGVPFPQGYGPEVPRQELALTRAPRVDSYRGFVFASLAADGPPLKEHLGAAAEAFDRLADLSPEGEVELTAGWLGHRVAANWKMAVENQVDGYHPRFVHESLFSAADYQVRELCSGNASSLARDLGGGHTELDFRPEYRAAGEQFMWFGRASAGKFPRYVAAMRDRYGAERADHLLLDGPPHVMVFPNLFLAEMNILVIEPVAPDRTVQWQTTVLLKGAPEVNRRALRQTEGAMGPAGLLITDDCEMMERNQAGLAARSPEWLELRRGVHREFSDAGGLASNVTDETSQRGIWRQYRRLMTAEAA